MPIDLDDLLPSWEMHLRAARKSPHTIRSYVTGVSQFGAWCDDEGRAALLERRTVTAWCAWLLEDDGKAPNTAIARAAGVRRFSAWLTDIGELARDDLAGMPRPKVDETAVEALTAAKIQALLATCGKTEFHDVRDRAIILLMTETGCRASELTGMELADIDVQTRRAIIRRGKGGKGRIVGFSPRCAEAIDLYLRRRRRHTLAHRETALWLGSNGRKFGYYGLYWSLRRRGESIGLQDFHPHILRNTSAVRWLRKGGSPQGLMAQAGWQSIDMLRRYIRAAEQELAAEEADRLGLGDDL